MAEMHTCTIQYCIQFAWSLFTFNSQTSLLGFSKFDEDMMRTYRDTAEFSDMQCTWIVGEKPANQYNSTGVSMHKHDTIISLQMLGM